MNEQDLKQILSPLLYERYSNLSDENKKIFIDALQNQFNSNTQITPNQATSNENSTQSYGGRVKVLASSGNGSTKEPENVTITSNNESKFDNAAFIDVLILSSITAFFGLISFLIILINYMN